MLVSIPSSQLSLFGLTEENLSCLNEKTLVVTKWNWSYGDAHAFQRWALNFVRENPVRVLICTSHPEVLTNGRGLQKPRKGESLNLIEFNPNEHQHLPFPLHQIERGGGLTFHHPGQFIFYPIVKLNPTTLSLSHMMNQIFDFSIEVLSDWGVRDLHHEHKLLGLWHKDKKLASMGIAIEKLITFHGMALNIFHHPRMKEALRSLNPCGLNSDTYSSVEDLISLPDNALEAFKTEFLKRIKHEWQ